MIVKWQATKDGIGQMFKNTYFCKKESCIFTNWVQKVRSVQDCCLRLIIKQVGKLNYTFLGLKVKTVESNV